MAFLVNRHRLQLHRLPPLLLPTLSLLLLQLLPTACSGSSVDYESTNTLDESALVALAARLSNMNDDTGSDADDDGNNNNNAVRDVTLAIDAYNQTLFQLFSLCYGDSICRGRFYLDAGTDAAVQPLQRVLSVGDRENFVRFKRLATYWALRQDSPLAATALDGALQLADYSPADATWWLRLLRTASTCSENERWEPDLGCVCPPDKTCHEMDASSHYWEITRLHSALVVALAVFVGLSGLAYVNSERQMQEARKVAERLQHEHGTASAPAASTNGSGVSAIGASMGATDESTTTSAYAEEIALDGWRASDNSDAVAAV